MEAVSWGVDTIIFAIMALVGVVLLVVSFVLGHVFDFASHDVDIDVAGHDVIEIGHGGEVPSAPAFINVQTILAFVTGFGATGWVLSGYFGVPPLFSGIAGLFGGVLLFIPAIFLYRTLYRQGATSSFRIEEAVGQEAVVSLEIPGIGVGRIQYQFAGTINTSLARSNQGKGIPTGATVRIVKTVGSEMYVERI